MKKEFLLNAEQAAVEDIRFQINRYLFEENIKKKVFLKLIVKYLKIILNRRGIVCKTLYEVFEQCNEIYQINGSDIINQLHDVDIKTIKQFAERVLKCE